MNTAIATTLIGVLGTGLLGFFILQLRTITAGLNRLGDQLSLLQKEVHGGFKDHGERLARIETTAKDHGERLARIETTAKDHGERLARIETTAKDHGERLARIETKLDNNLPVETS